MSKRAKFDMGRPDARRISDEIVHGAFITEGTMVAFPTCFPGQTIPVPADESHICALDVAHDGMVYAGTSGRATHLLVGMFHGVTGMVFGMGVVPGATQCPAIVCGKNKFIAAANGPAGGSLVSRKLEPLPFDLIQEWGISRIPFETIGRDKLAGEPIIHMVADGSQTKAIGITSTRLFIVDIEAGEVQVVAELAGRGQIARGDGGGIFGLCGSNSLWRLDLSTGTLDRDAAALPAGGKWSGNPQWARDSVTGTLYTADDTGTIYAFDEGSGFSAPLAKTPAAPVGPMAVTFDGRLYGSYGEGMSMLFCYHPETRELKNLGVAVSVLERRRYGYSFGAAAVGRDGQIYFGEDDDLGHLWIYFPPILGRRK